MPIVILGLSSKLSMSTPSEKCKNTTQGGADAKKSTSPTPLSHRGVAGDMANGIHNLKDDVDSLEERMSQMGTSFKMPFRFMQSSRSPSK